MPESLFQINQGGRTVSKVLSSLTEDQGKRLREYGTELSGYLELIREMPVAQNQDQLERVIENKSSLHSTMEAQPANQMQAIKKDGYRDQNTMLYFRLFLEIKDMMAVAARFIKIYDRFSAFDRRVSGEINTAAALPSAITISPHRSHARRDQAADGRPRKCERRHLLRRLSLLH